MFFYLSLLCSDDVQLCESSLVSVISVLLSVSLYCYVYVEKELGWVCDIKLWLVDNLCHKYWDSHYVMTGPVSGVWAQTITSMVWAHLGSPLYTVTGPPPGPGPGLAQHKPVSLRRSFQSAQESSEQTDCQCQSVRKLRKLEPGQSFSGPICGRLAFKCDRNDFTRWLISCEKCQGPGLWVRMSEECQDCHCDDQLTRPD